MKAAIVETSGFFQGILRKLLESRGWEVHCFDSGRELLTQEALQGQLSLVCLSSVSKDLSGAAAASGLRSRNFRGPLVLITAQNPQHPLAENHPQVFDQIFTKADLEPLQQYIDGLTLQRAQGPLKVLYVEDSPLAAKIIQFWARGWGWDLRHFTTAEEAWEAFTQSAWDLVLTDHYLDGKLQGLDLLKLIRTSPKHRIPVILMSGVTSDEERRTMLSQGADALLPKPHQKADLEALIHRLFPGR